MSLTPFLRLNMCALLVFFCSSPISCFANKWNNCRSVNRCGNFNFSYPFGKIHNGCGDPDFQLACDRMGQHPLLNIRGNEYQILEPSILGNNTTNHSIMIAIDDFQWDKCKLLDNYSQSWLHGSRYFEIAHGYTNLTLWRDCNQSNYLARNMLQLSLCGNVWYYSLSPEIDLNGTHFCKTHLQLPIKEDVLQLKRPIDNKIFSGQGFEIRWHVDPYRDQNCGACSRSNGICGYNKSKAILCYCRDGTSQPHKCHDTGDRNKSGGRNKSGIIIGCSIGGVVLTALTVVLVLKFYMKKRNTLSRDFTSSFSKHKRKDIKAAGLSELKIGNLPIFSYEELCQATNFFHKENEVGDGGFGSVYLGKVRDGRSVVVKRIYQDNARRVEQFLNEVMTISTLNHPRVVRFYGCAYEDSPDLLLVYEFVPNGTLADHLHGHRRGPKGLPWDTRLNIAIQTAQALAFLHSLDPPLFHRDVKSSNILLDEDFNVKIADFGLCRLIHEDASYVTTSPQGTPRYVDPEYHQCYQLPENSDVYSFGVVLLEIISGQLAVDIDRKRREINLANMPITKIQERVLHELVDRQLEIEMNQKMKVVVSAAAELAFRCLVSERDDSPQMNEVVAQLEQIRR